MSLPGIEGFPSHILELAQTHTHQMQGSTSDMDLDKFHKSLFVAKEAQQELAMHRDDVINPTHLLYQMFDKSFLHSFEYMIHPIISKHIGYSKKHQSLSISLFDDNGRVQAIATRRAKDREGNLIKWKTYGSKTYIPHKIKDDFIFLAVGMAEFLLLEMIQASYILLQSDSVYRHISPEIVAKTVGRYIIILKENDISFENLIEKLKEIFHASTIIIIDFEKMLGKKLAKGFDAVDCVNELKKIQLFEQMLEDEMVKQIKAKKW